MTLSIRLETGGLTSGLAEAGAEITRLAEEEIVPAATLIEDAFAGAARSIERELVRAAHTGELSLKRLGRSLVTDLIRATADNVIRRPIETALTAAFAAPFGGGRAEGGPVAPGHAYLVGERGPELFTPSAAGAVSPSGARPINVTIALPGVRDAESFRASETQIAAGLARVLAKGARNQ